MNEKKRIEDALNAFFDRRAALQKEIQDLKLDTRYTAEHQRTLLHDKEQEIGRQAEKTMEAVKSVIGAVKSRRKSDQAKTAREAQTSPYQTRLNGLLAALRLGAKLLADEQILTHVRPFRDDPLAMAAIRGAMKGAGLDDQQISRIMEKAADYETEAKALDDLTRNVGASLSMHPIYGMNLERAAIDMLLSRWNDDLDPC